MPRSTKYLPGITGYYTIQEGITSLCVSSPSYSPERGGVGGLGPDTPLTPEPLLTNQDSGERLISQ